MREPEMILIEQPEAGPSYWQQQQQQQPSPQQPPHRIEHRTSPPQQLQYVQHHPVRPRPQIVTRRHDTLRSPSPALPSPSSSSSHHSGADDDAMMIDAVSVSGGSPLPDRGLTTRADNRALPPLDFSTIRVPFPTRTAEDERALWMLNRSFHSVVKNG